MHIAMRDNNIVEVLRIMKKIQRKGIFRELKRRRAYEKPSEKRNCRPVEAIGRDREAARKQMQGDGVLPAPQPREVPCRDQALTTSYSSTT